MRGWAGEIWIAWVGGRDPGGRRTLLGDVSHVGQAPKHPNLRRRGGGLCVALPAAERLAVDGGAKVAASGLGADLGCSAVRADACDCEGGRVRGLKQRAAHLGQNKADDARNDDDKRRYAEEPQQ